MNLADLKNRQITYDWKTIYVGIIENYFDVNIISDYAIELIQKGNDDVFVSELAWGVESDNSKQVLSDVKLHFCQNIDDSNYQNEARKLRFIYLAKLNSEITNEDELLKEIAYFYDNHSYPVDMASFINYVPQDFPTTKADLISRFYEFLETEKNEVN